MNQREIVGHLSEEELERFAVQCRAEAALSQGFYSIAHPWRARAIFRESSDFAGGLASYGRMFTCEPHDVEERARKLGITAAEKLCELCESITSKCIEVAFLNGRESPRAEVRDLENGKVEVRCYLDVGVQDPQFRFTQLLPPGVKT